MYFIVDDTRRENISLQIPYSTSGVMFYSPVDGLLMFYFTFDMLPRC
jgi:hypothetical protein